MKWSSELTSDKVHAGKIPRPSDPVKAVKTTNAVPHTAHEKHRGIWYLKHTRSNEMYSHCHGFRQHQSEGGVLRMCYSVDYFNLATRDFKLVFDSLYYISIYVHTGIIQFW